MNRQYQQLLILIILLLVGHCAWAETTVSATTGTSALSTASLDAHILPRPARPSEAHYRIDRVLVKKGERRMLLLQDGEPVRNYRISLGRNPKGHKLFSGDQRTPEGVYTLDARNANSDFHKSIRISYPNQEDRRKASAWGQDPGGSIMIHGLPNDADEWAFAYVGLDWTEGCIAVTNEEMDEIWQLVRNGTTIEIRP